MVQVVLPNDANPLGFILGGTVMHLIDIAGAIACHRQRRARARNRRRRRLHRPRAPRRANRSAGGVSRSMTSDFSLHSAFSIQNSALP